MPPLLRQRALRVHGGWLRVLSDSGEVKAGVIAEQCEGRIERRTFLGVMMAGVVAPVPSLSPARFDICVAEVCDPRTGWNYIWKPIKFELIEIGNLIRMNGGRPMICTRKPCNPIDNGGCFSAAEVWP